MNIVYLYPVFEKPTGGIKVVYRHSELLNENGVPSEILHSKNPKVCKGWFWPKPYLRGVDFRCSWFDHNATIRTPKLKIDPEKDFVVIPEIWAASFGNYLRKQGIHYAIFNQGAYSTKIGIRDLTEDDLRNAYENADIILSISEDTTKVINLKYPTISTSKILRIIPGIDTKLFSSGHKEKLITYMPRRLPDHITQMMFLLRDLLPAGWEFAPIDNLSEKGVAALLSRSSIFMSFCDQEGCPLPPLEAAFSGNIVVGYTGQGASEYFHKPLFRRVENGNFIEFTTAVLQSITDIENGFLESNAVIEQVKTLSNAYSMESALTNLLLFSGRVQSLIVTN